MLAMMTYTVQSFQILSIGNAMKTHFLLRTNYRYYVRLFHKNLLNIYWKKGVW